MMSFFRDNFELPGGITKNMLPFPYHDGIILTPTIVSDGKMKLTSSHVRCFIERASDDVYTVTHLLTSLTGDDRQRLVNAKFLVINDKMVYLEKKFDDSLVTSGYWGRLPKKGYININKQIKYNHDGHAIFSRIIGDKAVCYFSYSVDADETINVRVGEIRELEYFGL